MLGFRPPPPHSPHASPNGPMVCLFFLLCLLHLGERRRRGRSKKGKNRVSQGQAGPAVFSLALVPAPPSAAGWVAGARLDVPVPS